LRIRRSTTEYHTSISHKR